jgi:hypothetical protein
MIRSTSLPSQSLLISNRTVLYMAVLQTVGDDALLETRSQRREEELRPQAETALCEEALVRMREVNEVAQERDCIARHDLAQFRCARVHSPAMHFLLAFLCSSFPTQRGKYDHLLKRLNGAIWHLCVDHAVEQLVVPD